jgi:hypothetical protein
MKSIVFCVAAAMLACRGGSAQTRIDFPDPASLGAELRALQHSVSEENAQQFSAALPPAWHVHTLDGDYSISTAPLRALLNGSSVKTGRNSPVPDAQTWLSAVAEQLDTYADPPPPSTARADIRQILSRPEFTRDGSEEQWDRIGRRIAALIANWMRGLFQLSGRYSTGGFVVFWLAVTGAAGLLGFWLIRTWRRSRYRFELAGSPPAAPVRGSRQWIEASRHASAQGDFSRAIQCGYWAGIASLQESGAAAGDLIRTPREYLRILSDARRDNIIGPGVMIPLKTLTFQMERFWYAREPATAHDYSLCLGYLEALGCKAD